MYGSISSHHQRINRKNHWTRRYASIKENYHMIGTIKPIYTLKYPTFNRHSFHLILFPIEDSLCFSHARVTPRLNVKEGGSRAYTLYLRSAYYSRLQKGKFIRSNMGYLCLRVRIFALISRYRRQLIDPWIHLLVKILLFRRPCEKR